MRKNLLRLLGLALLLSGACTTEPAETPPSEPSGHRVSEEQALAALHALLSAIDKTTRSGGRTVAGISTVRADELLPATRSRAAASDLDELVYIANFDGDAGYAILGADDRMPSVIAITERGSLSPAELTDPDRGRGVRAEAPAVAPVMENYLRKAADSISLQYIGGGDPVVTLPTYSPWETIAENNPITFIYTKWGQGAPFNNYTPTVSGKHCPAGCVAVACGQLLTWSFYHFRRHDYQNKPKEIGGYAIDWNTIFASFEDNKAGDNKFYKSSNSNHPQWDAIARLLRGLGLKFDMNYTSDGSGTYDRYVFNYMIELYFKHPRSLSYAKNEILSSLKIGYPVYMYGRTYTDATHSDTDGHAWLVDGFCKQERTVTEKEGTFPNYIYNTFTEERLLFHCNFGWAARCDGYYIADIFDLTNGPIFQHEIDDDNLPNNDTFTNCNFNMRLMTITFIGL